MDLSAHLSAFHPTRRSLIKGVLKASGYAPALLLVLKHASAMSGVPIIPGIQELSGDVRVNAMPAVLLQEIKPGDVVATGADGSCVIIIGEHVYMIREDSEIEFYPDYFIDADNTSPSGLITMAAGAMLSVFDKTTTTLNTPTATIGIRGTACYMEVHPDRTYACVCYGRAELSSSQDNLLLETVVTKHHDKPRYIYPADSSIRIEVAPIFNHTDAELRMLEALVNRKTPFDKIKRGKKDKSSDRY
jgi:hypothetical protein